VEARGVVDQVAEELLVTILWAKDGLVTVVCKTKPQIRAQSMLSAKE
jgi:hypothetical protein